MKLNILSIFLFSCLMCGMLQGSTPRDDSEQPIEKKPFIPSKLFLKGSPYELGYQHGHQLKEAVAYNIQRIVDHHILANPENPQIKSFIAQLPKVLEHIPQDYLQELKGLADGAGLSYQKILLLNLFPEMFHCSGLTFKGKATKNEDLYHVRVLDYAVGKNFQDTAVLMIVQPDGKIPFLNVSYAGFIGSVTGMNGQHIAIGEIGGKGYGQYEGMPMVFLLRKILEEAHSLPEVKRILAETARTCEYYYLFSDGKTGDSIGVYATSQQLQFIEPGSSYALFEGPSSDNGNFAEAADDKRVFNQSQIEISPYQTLLFKDLEKKQLWGLIHTQPENCLILTGFSQPLRYPVLVQRIFKRYGMIGVADLQEIIKGEAALPSNLHTAIFAPSALDVWIAHAGPQGEPAWSQSYEYFNLNDLLQEGKTQR